MRNSVSIQQFVKLNIVKKIVRPNVERRSGDLAKKLVKGVKKL